jgi:hypothetical protein
LKNRAEVIAMVLYEFDIEKYKQQQEDKITLLQDTVQKQQLTLQQKDEVLQQKDEVLQQQQNDFHDALQQKDEEITILKRLLAQYQSQEV